MEIQSELARRRSSKSCRRGCHRVSSLCATRPPASANEADWTPCQLAGKLWEQRTHRASDLMQTWEGNCNSLMDGVAASVLYLATGERASVQATLLLSQWLSVAVALTEHGICPDYFDALSLQQDQRYPVLPDIMCDMEDRTFDLFSRAVERGVYIPSLANVMQMVVCLDGEDFVWSCWTKGAQLQLQRVRTAHPALFRENPEVRPGLRASEVDASMCSPRYADAVASKMLAALCVSVFSGRRNGQGRTGPAIPLLILEGERTHLRTGPLKWIAPPNPVISVFVRVQRSSLDASCHVRIKKHTPPEHCWLREALLIRKSRRSLVDDVMPERIQVYATPNRITVQPKLGAFSINIEGSDRRWEFSSQAFVPDASRALSYSFANFRDKGVRLFPMLPCDIPNAVDYGPEATSYGTSRVDANHASWRPIRIAVEVPPEPPPEVPLLPKALPTAMSPPNESVEVAPTRAPPSIPPPPPPSTQPSESTPSLPPPSTSSSESTKSQQTSGDIPVPAISVEDIGNERHVKIHYKLSPEQLREQLMG